MRKHQSLPHLVEPMSRPLCHACRRPQATCLCPCITPFRTRMRFILLTHPKEYRSNRIGTGRITHLSLPCSEVHVGTDFRRHARVNAIIDAPDTDCRLVYPGTDGENLSRGEYHPVPRRRPVFCLVDATWTCAGKILRCSDNVRGLPRVGFDATGPSAFAIKRQPRPGCLATIEAAWCCLTLLAADGHEDFGARDGRWLLAPFQHIMEIQQGYPGASRRGVTRAAVRTGRAGPRGPTA